MNPDETTTIPERETFGESLARHIKIVVAARELLGLDASAASTDCARAVIEDVLEQL